MVRHSRGELELGYDACSSRTVAPPSRELSQAEPGLGARDGVGVLAEPLERRLGARFIVRAEGVIVAGSARLTWVRLWPFFWAALACGVGARLAAAQEVRVQCERLRPGEIDELRARGRLTIDASRFGPAPELVEVHCDHQRTWIRWVGPPVEELEVDESGGLVEGTLDALDRRVRERPSTGSPPREAQVEPPTERDPGRESTAARGVEPDRAREPKPPRRPTRMGGAGLGVSVDPTPLAVGPELDLGLGARGLSGVASQALRAGIAESTLGLETRMGLAWGAPFTSGFHWGVVALGGVEALAHVGRRPRTHAKSSVVAPTLGLGLRAATELGDWSLWAGLDGAWRVWPLELGAPFNLSLPRVHALLTVGAFWLAESPAR